MGNAAVVEGELVGVGAIDEPEVLEKNARG